MDQLVRTLTEKLKKALPHNGKILDSGTYTTQDCTSSSVESNCHKSVCFLTNNTRITKKQHNKQTPRRPVEPKKTIKNNRYAEPRKRCKRKK